MKCYQPKLRTRRKLRRKIFERVNKPKWVIPPRESNQTSLKHKSLVIPYMT